MPSTPTVDPDLIVVFPLWVVVLGGVLLHHVIHLPDDEIPGLVLRYANRTASHEREGRPRD